MTIDVRLVVPALAAWLAAGLLVGAPEAAVVAAITSGIAALVLALVGRRATWLAVIALACAVTALCATSVAVLQEGRHPAVLVDAADDGRFVTLVVELTSTARPGDAPIEARVTSATMGEHSIAIAVPVLIFDSEPQNVIGIGSTVELSGTMQRTERGDDVSFLVFASEPVRLIAPAPWFLEWANGLRATFVYASAGFAEPGGTLLPGLAIGDDSGVPEDLDAAMKTSSLSHLTAVSGANCAIVIGLIMAVGAATGMPRSLRIAGALATLLAFVVLVTPEPSVLRAALMAALVLASLSAGRPVRGLPVVSLAVIALLTVDPWLSRSFGFALSVLATAGLLVLAAPISRLLARVMPLPIAALIAVPLSAQLACQPVLILLEASIPTYGVIANLLAAPAAPVATIVGLLACVTLPVVPVVGTVLTGVAWLPSAWIAAVAQFFSTLPMARLPWHDGAIGLVLLAALTALALVASLTRWRRWPAIALVVSLVLYGGVAGGQRILDVLSRPNWQIAACDIGQGDAVLIRSADHIALVDTGPDPVRLADCLTDLGIGRIDLLVLTHFDLDHVGGVPAVLGRATTVLSGPPGEPDDSVLLDELAQHGATTQPVSRGDTGRLGNLAWQILWPRERLGGIEPGNDASVTMTFIPDGECESGCLSSLFLGDLSERAQVMMAAGARIPVVDVVKVSHHGSADQSASLYERAGATVGVIGVGADNGYGHPTSELLGMLESVGTSAARTDEQGLILIAPGVDPGTVTVWSERH